MKLGVVAALGRELNSTLQSLNASTPVVQDSFSIREAPPFRFIAGGIGLTKAERAARAVAENATGILSVGFCGALDDTLSPGDLVLGGAIGFDPSPDLLALAQKTGPHRTGTFNTIDHVVVDIEEKRSIARTTGAIAVDMEAAAVGKVALDRGLPFLCVKVVIDTPSAPLASNYASVGRVMLDLLKRPWLVRRMIGDGTRATLGAEKLRDFFVALRKEINPSAG